MRTSTKLGLLAAMVGLSVACSAPVPQSGAPAKPAAVARATSSAITKKVSGVSQWRVYQGRTNLVVLGFGKDKKPVDGLRFRFASSKTRRWAVSLEMVRGNGALQIDRNGKVVRNTMNDEEVGVMFGATRVLEAWRKSAARASTGTRSVAYADTAGGALTCLNGGREVLKDCGPVVAKCAGAAGRAGMRAGRLGLQAGAIVGGAVLAKCAWQNRSAVYKCGKSAYENGKECYEKLTEKDESEEKKNPPPEDKEKPEEKTEGEDAGAPEEPAEDAGAPEEPAEDAGAPEGEDAGAPEEPDPDGGVLVASEDEPGLESTAEEREEDTQVAEEDPENAPVEDEVAEPQTETSEDEVDPDPPQEEEPASEEPASEEPASEEPEAPSDEGALVSAFGLGRTLGTRAVASRGSSHSGACGATRTLVCGARKSASYCRCVR